MRIRAGRLRHRLTLQYKSETRTSTGDVVTAWVTDSTVWGAIEPLSGSEFLAASQTQNETSVRILIRYHATIAETWRVVNDGKAYSILSVINSDERDNATVLMCSRGVVEEGSIPSDEDDEFYVVNNGINVLNSGEQVVHTS